MHFNLKKITIVKSIFCPNDTYFDINCNAIKNLFELLNRINQEKMNSKIHSEMNPEMNFRFNLVFIGWTKKELYQGKIKICAEKYSENITSIQYDLWKLN